MAPPPSADMPLTQRLLHLVQTLQFGWFAGHLTLLLCVLRYGLSYITFNYYSGWARYSYRTAFVSAAVTYGIVVYKAYMARIRGGAAQRQNLIALAGDENVQYMVMALTWLFFYQVPLALLPFAVYSVFHVATYTRANLIPTISPAKPSATSASPGGGGGGARPKTTSPLADTIGRFVKQYYDASMMLVASLEILLWFRVLMSALSFAKGSWLLLLLYTVFVRARYSQSTFVQGAIAQAGQRGDALVANQSTPPAARQAWFTVKGLAQQAVDATDASRYLGGQKGKKAQ